MQDPNQVRFEMTKMKGHVFLWWDMPQKDRAYNQHEKINIWRKMVSKIKGKFLHVDFQHNLCKKVHNSRQREM